MQLYSAFGELCPPYPHHGLSPEPRAQTPSSPSIDSLLDLFLLQISPSPKLLPVVDHIFAFDRRCFSLTHFSGWNPKHMITKFGVRKLETYGSIVWCEMPSSVLNLLDVDHECGGRTDRHSDGSVINHSSHNGHAPRIIVNRTTARYSRKWLTDVTSNENPLFLTW